MAPKTIVYLGDPTVDVEFVRVVATEFGWEFRELHSLDQLRQLPRHRVIAVLFDHNYLMKSCAEVTLRVRAITPNALAVACQRFSDQTSFQELARGGAYHAVFMPFSPSELRICFGFVAQACPPKAGAPQPRPERAPAQHWKAIA
jgi:hypothetical protein